MNSNSWQVWNYSDSALNAGIARAMLRFHTKFGYSPAELHVSAGVDLGGIIASENMRLIQDGNVKPGYFWLGPVVEAE